MTRDRIEELTRVEKEIACYIYKFSKYSVAAITLSTLFKPDVYEAPIGDKNIIIGLFSEMIEFDNPTLIHVMRLLENKDICKDYDQIDEELKEVWDEITLPSCSFGDYDPLNLPEHIMEYIRSYHNGYFDQNYVFRIKLSSRRVFSINYKTFCEALVEYNRISYEIKRNTGRICLKNTERFKLICTIYTKDIESLLIERIFNKPNEYGEYKTECLIS